jgi:hypothetical protein
MQSYAKKRTGDVTGLPPVNTEDGAVSESDDDGFQLKVHATPDRVHTPDSSPHPSPPQGVEGQVIDVSAHDPVEEDVLRSESASEEEIQATASPPRNEKRNPADGFGLKSAAAGAQEALSEISRKKIERESFGILRRPPRGIESRFKEPDVDLTSRSRHRDGEMRRGMDDELETLALSG